MRRVNSGYEYNQLNIWSNLTIRKPVAVYQSHDPCDCQLLWPCLLGSIR